MNGQKCRTVGSLWAISQGLLAAAVPQFSVKMVKRMLGRNFENASDLEAKPGYLRQLRALGIGLAAAGIASFVMETVAADSADDTPAAAVDEGTPDGADGTNDA